MKHASLLLLFLFSQLLTAHEKATNFLRVEENKTSVHLETSITRYQKRDITVDLIGALHIADAGYYKKLNQKFKDYDSLLFEMVGGEVIEQIKKQRATKQSDTTLKGKRKSKRQAKDPLLNILGNVYDKTSQFLELSSQNQCINYFADNFVHADLTLAEFEKLQKKRKESVLGFFLKSALKSGKKQGSSKQYLRPNSNIMLAGLLMRDANIIKIEMVKSLGQADDQINNVAGDNVIITDRNARCMKVLSEQIKAQKTKIGIFYGAAHFPEMEKRIIKEGFKKKKQHWITAWNITKTRNQNVFKKEKNKPKT